MEVHSAPVSCHHYGFREHHQTMEIVETSRLVIQKAAAWNINGCLLKGDINRAFDNMSHDALDMVLNEIGAPPQIRYAIAQEYLDNEVSLLLHHFQWDKITFLRGGRQGGTDTPSLWVRYLDHIVQKAVKKWEFLGWGIHFPPEGVPPGAISQSQGDAGAVDICKDGLWVRILIWADDCIIFGSSPMECRNMFLSLCEEMKPLGLSWKAGSLEMIQIGDGWGAEVETDALYWKFEGHPYKIACKNSFVVLGAKLDSKASSQSMSAYRIEQSWVHFWSRRSTFLNNKIPLRMRIARLDQTVGRTLLYSSGAWGHCQAACGAAASAYRKMLKMMLCRRRAFGVSVADFHHSLEIRLNMILDDLGWVPILAQIEKSFVSWMGHVARKTFSEPLKFLMFWREAEWRLVENYTSPARYARPGRPVTTSCAAMSSLCGPSWADAASDRNLWACVVAEKVKNSLPICMHSTVYLQRLGLHLYSQNSVSLLPNRFLDFISNKHLELLAGARLGIKSNVCLVTGSDVLCRAVKGCLKSAVAPRYWPYIKFLRILLYLWEIRWGVSPMPGFSEILNSSTDAVPFLDGFLEMFNNTLTPESWEWFAAVSESEAETLYSFCYVYAKGCWDADSKQGVAFSSIQVFSNEKGLIPVAFCFCKVDSDCLLTVEYEAACLASRLFVKFLCRSVWATRAFGHDELLKHFCDAKIC
jgi:hypothetical protein